MINVFYEPRIIDVTWSSCATHRSFCTRSESFRGDEDSECGLLCYRLTPCDLVDGYYHFWWAYCSNLQAIRDIVPSSEALVPIDQKTRRHNPEDQKVNFACSGQTEVCWELLLSRWPETITTVLEMRCRLNSSDLIDVLHIATDLLRAIISKSQRPSVDK
jgi:hypothetical protein